jgi:uridine kinase
LQDALQTLQHLAESGQLPFAPSQVRSQIDTWRENGYPACRHTQTFRDAYAPAYRVLRRDFAWALPLFAAIDCAMTEKPSLLVAIEGSAGAGKSTLAQLLSQVYDCNVFHMDDFFLRPEQRTAERFATPGGNVDHERFLTEVLTPLQAGQSVSYRRFDCSSFTVLPPVEVPPKALNIIEGSYSCHPALAQAYDLKVFLQIDPQLQAQRIRARNSAFMQERFFNEWIPMERMYFEAFDTQHRCDLTLEVTP